MRRRLAWLGVALALFVLVGYWRYEPPSRRTIAASPDESLIALTVSYGSCAEALAIYRSGSSTPTTLLSSHPAKLVDSIFSLDGKALLVLENDPGENVSKLLRIDLESLDTEVLRTGPGEWRDLDLSASGKLIVLLNYLQTDHHPLRSKSIVEVVDLSSNESGIVYAGTTFMVSPPRFIGDTAVSFVAASYDQDPQTLAPDTVPMFGDWVEINLQNKQTTVLGHVSITAFPTPVGANGYLLRQSRGRGGELVHKSRAGIYSRLFSSPGPITNYRISPEQGDVYVLAAPSPRPFSWSFIGASKPEALKVDLATRSVRELRLDRPILMRSALCL